jgi:hypothetical protein
MIKPYILSCLISLKICRKKPRTRLVLSYTLKFPTFTETAELAGVSRVLGGHHIQADNVAGLKLGRDLAHEVWGFYKKYVGEE